MQLTRDCKVEVQRILHQRALDVKLDPELQKRCMTDLGKWCSEKTDTGQVQTEFWDETPQYCRCMMSIIRPSSQSLFGLFQELECLQDHLEDLVSNCRDVVGNLTELESEVRFLFHTTALHKPQCGEDHKGWGRTRHCLKDRIFCTVLLLLEFIYIYIY